jgi:hypothetical protein
MNFHGNLQWVVEEEIKNGVIENRSGVFMFIVFCDFL